MHSHVWTTCCRWHTISDMVIGITGGKLWVYWVLPVTTEMDSWAYHQSSFSNTHIMYALMHSVTRMGHTETQSTGGMWPPCFNLEPIYIGHEWWTAYPWWWLLLHQSWTHKSSSLLRWHSIWPAKLANWRACGFTSSSNGWHMVSSLTSHSKFVPGQTAWL